MAKRKSFLIFSLMAAGLSLILTSQVNAAPQNKRLWGNDRYGTCSSIVQDGWRSNCEYAVIVNGENFPDALSASTLAKKYNAPILLTQNDALNDNTYNQLKRLNVKKVFIVGGDFVVKPVVEQTIKSMGIETIRYKGQDRNETSIKVAEQIGTSNGIILTTNNDFVDALSVAPIAAKLQMPIILMPKDTVPESVKGFVSGKNISTTYVLGGTDIISDAVTGYFPNVKRIGGQNKYERNINIINAFSDKFNFDNIYLAYSEKFADALSGSAIAALEGNPIVLMGDTTTSTTSNFIKNKLSSINQINILGGNAGIKDEQLSAILGENSNNRDLGKYWSGNYYASQGKTSLVLTINDITSDGNISDATFEFGPLKENTNVPTGSYKMSGKLNKDDGSIELTGEKWIKQPVNFEMLDIHGKVDLKNHSISGYVSSQKTKVKSGDLNISYIDSATLDSNIKDALGSWVGNYYANQGKTSITLKINDISDDGSISNATFNFGPNKDNPNIPSGSYEMSGKLNRINNTIELNGVKWINQPNNYMMLDIHGEVDLKNHIINGYVTNSGTTQKVGDLNISYTK